MLLVRPELDSEKRIMFDVDGEKFTAEEDARLFAVASDAVGVLKDLLDTVAKVGGPDKLHQVSPEWLKKRLEELVERAKPIVNYASGSIIDDCVVLEKVRELQKTCNRGLISGADLNMKLIQLFGGL